MQNDDKYTYAVETVDRWLQEDDKYTYDSDLKQEVETKTPLVVPEQVGGFAKGTEVELNANLEANPTFDRDKWLMDKYGLTPEKENKIVSWLNANAGNKDVTKEDVKAYYASIGAGNVNSEDIDIAKLREGKGTYIDFDHREDEAAYHKSLLDTVSEDDKRDNTDKLIEQGLVLNLSDELAGLRGAGEALLEGENTVDGYTQARDRERLLVEQARQEEELKGVIVETLASLPASIFLPYAKAKTAADMAKGGAAAGALYGFGDGDGVGDSVKKGGLNAAIGAVAAPVIGKTVQHGSEVIAKRLQGKGSSVDEVVDEALPEEVDVSAFTSPKKLTPKAETKTKPLEIPERPKYVKTEDGNINQERLILDDDVYEVLAEEASGLDIPKEDFDAISSKAGKILETKTPSRILSHDPKLSEAQEYGIAKRYLLKKELENSVNLSKKYLDTPSGDLTPAMEQEIALSRASLAASVESVAGHSKGTGRALNAQKVLIEDINAGRAASNTSSDISSSDWARVVLQHSDDAEALKQLAADSLKPRFTDKLTSYWYNMVLSGPWTHFRNVVSTAANVLTDVVENAGAASFGSLKKTVGAGNKRDLSWGEMGQRLKGLVEGTKDGAKNFTRTYNKGAPLDNVLRLDEIPIPTSSGLGSIFQAPTRLLAAEDEVFRSIASKSELLGLAHRAAKREGLKGKDLISRRKEILSNPETDVFKSIAKEAERKGKELRFQEDLGKWIEDIENARRYKTNDTKTIRAGKFAARMVVPFMKTINGLLKTAGRRSPFGVFSSKIQKDLAAGGARRHKAVSQMTIGTLASYYVLTKAMRGEISGEGPSDYRKKADLETSGWRPNSILGDDGVWYSYRGLDPFATNMGAIATLVEKQDEISDEQWDTQLGLLIKTAIEQVGGTSIVSGVLDTATVVKGRDSGWESYLANLGASFVVPNLVNQLNATFGDDRRRVTKGDGSVGDRFEGAVKTRLPVFSEDRPLKHDTLGREIHKNSLLKGSKQSTDIVDKVLYSLKGLKTSPIIGYPSSTVTDNDEDYQKYVKESGKLIHERLTEEFSYEGWEDYDDDEKLEIINDIKKDARKEARETLFSDDEDDSYETDEPVEEGKYTYG